MGHPCLPLPCCQDPILARSLKSAGSYGATSGIRTRPSKQSRTYFRLAASRKYAPYPCPPFDLPPYSGRLLSDPSGSGPKSTQNLIPRKETDSPDSLPGPPGGRGATKQIKTGALGLSTILFMFIRVPPLGAPRLRAGMSFLIEGTELKTR